MSEDNLSLWSRVEETPSDIVRQRFGDDGRQLNSVSSINRIKKATEEFGLYGVKWGLKGIKHEVVQLNNLFIAAIDATFFVHSGGVDVEFEISSSMGIVSKSGDSWVVNTTYRKAIESDLINKALSRLGFFADIYSDDELIKPEMSAEDVISSMELIEITGEEDGCIAE